MAYYTLMGKYWTFRFNLKAAILINRWKFRHWMFQWKTDDDGDIALVLFGLLAFVKYKESTLVRRADPDWNDARRHVDAEKE